MIDDLDDIDDDDDDDDDDEHNQKWSHFLNISRDQSKKCGKNWKGAPFDRFQTCCYVWNSSTNLVKLDDLNIPQQKIIQFAHVWLLTIWFWYI